ncbi:MAG: putative Ig domain-containing protein [archaeon]|nr:putative Ig domain-containing protein [archaeon]
MKLTSALAVLALVSACFAGVMFTDEANAENTSGLTYNVGIVEGATYSYTPAFSLSGVTITLSGTAASWLTVNNGVISGTAPAVSAAGGTATYDLTITAKTTKPVQTATQMIHFTVYDTLSGSVTVSNSNLYTGCTPSFTVTSCYQSGVTYALSGAPAGLSINSSTGVISGTVTDAGTTSGKSFTVKVTETHLASGQTKDVTVAVKVYSKLAQNTTTYGKDMYVVNGEVVTTDTSSEDYNKVVSNITSGVTYALKSGSTMPSGLILNSNGTITGTCTAMGDKTVTVVATQTATGQTVDCTMNIHSVGKLSFSSVPTGGIVATAA